MIAPAMPPIKKPSTTMMTASEIGPRISALNPPPPRALPLAQESLTKQPIVRHSVYQNQCDDDCAYKNPNLVCFAPRPIRAVNPENLADQISNHAVMRKALTRSKGNPGPYKVQGQFASGCSLRC